VKKSDINIERLESIPYQALYNKRITYNKVVQYLLYAALFFGFLSIIVEKYGHSNIATFIISGINLLILIAATFCTWREEIYVAPEAEYERIGGAIDEGFGTKILIKEVDKKYYNNKNLELGIQRLVANTFESCFYTDRISKAMTIKKTIPTFVFCGLFIIGLICNMYTPVFSVQCAIVILQVLTSSVLMEQLLKHLSFRRYIQKELQNFISIHSALDHDSLEFQARAIYSIINYEKALSHYNTQLDSKIFNELNPKLEKEWEEMKKRYKIESEEQKG
jgi:hypothetical protein